MSVRIGLDNILKPDLCILGAGSAAMEAAAAGAMLGATVVLVLSEEEPDHSLASLKLAAIASQAHLHRQNAAAHVFAPSETVDFAALRRSIAATGARLAADHAPERFSAMGITVLRAPAYFSDRQVVVSDAIRIRARRYIIAPQLQPDVPDIDGLAELPYLTVDTVFSLQRLPERLVLIGSDPEAIVLAQSLRRLGAGIVIIVEKDLLPGVDPELARVIGKALLDDGILIRTATRVRAVEPKFDGVALHLQTPTGEEQLDASHILLGFGRKPALAALGLEAAGVTTADGQVIVDARLRTSNPRIFHIRADQRAEAGLAVQNALFRAGKALQPEQIPSVIQTRPELACVGLSEEQARKRHKRIEVLRWPFSENRRALAEGTPDGFTKVITDRKGIVVGAAIVGPQAGDLIVPWILAVSRKISVQEMSQISMPSLALSDISSQTARRYSLRRLQKSSPAFALKFNRWLG